MDEGGWVVGWCPVLVVVILMPSVVVVVVVVRSFNSGCGEEEVVCSRVAGSFSESFLN